MFHVLHPSTQGQAQCPTSRDKHTEMATVPFRALFFPPKGRQRARASEGKEHGSGHPAALSFVASKQEPPAPDLVQAARE